jgi:hypothetical protein
MNENSVLRKSLIYYLGLDNIEVEEFSGVQLIAA